MTAINQANNRPNIAIDMTATTALQVEPLEKVAKIGHKTIEYVATYTLISAPFQALMESLKGTVAFFETVQFVGRVKELICLDDKGNSFFAVNSWQKCVDRVTLAIHSSMKAIRTLAKLGIVNLGRFAANIAGKLSIFSFATDAFILTSCVFSIWDTINKGLKNRKELSDARTKIEKWEYRKTLIAQVDSGIQSEIKTLQTKYEQKLTNAQNTAEKVQKYSHRLNLIHAHNNQGLANELEKADVSFKLRKWSVIESNATLVRNKVLLGIANSSFKIGVVVFAMALSATNCFTAALIRPLLLGGIATDSIGLTKIFYDQYNKPAPVPQKPVVTAPTV